MFKIGDFSKLTNLTVKALHHYEELGLLLPEKSDSMTNYRYYSAQQLPIVNQIKRLQQIGMPLKEIKEVLQSEDKQLLEAYYEARAAEICDELAALKKKQIMIKIYQEKIQTESYNEKYHVELKELPRRKVMAIRQKISAFDEEHQLWNELQAEFIKQNIKMAKPPLGVSIYHDKEYKDSNIDIEIQSSIVGDYHETEVVKFYETTEFTLASVTFNGSYEQMPEVTQAIAAWIEANCYRICGPMVNIFYVSPAQDANPENWVTEAGFMVRKVN